MATATNRSLEDRIRAIEDRLEIYNLIASHPPSADTGGRDHIAASWVEDGVFDRGEPLRGRSAIAEQVMSPEHQAAIAGGLAHFTGLPHVAIDGDTAIVTSYSGDPGATDAGQSGRGSEPRQRQGLPRAPVDCKPLGAGAHRHRLEGRRIATCASSTARSPHRKSCAPQSAGSRINGRPMPVATAR